MVVGRVDSLMACCGSWSGVGIEFLALSGGGHLSSMAFGRHQRIAYLNMPSCPIPRAVAIPGEAVYCAWLPFLFIIRSPAYHFLTSYLPTVISLLTVSCRHHRLLRYPPTSTNQLSQNNHVVQSRNCQSHYRTQGPHRFLINRDKEAYAGGHAN